MPNMTANPITEDRESEARDKVDPLIKKGGKDGNGSSSSQPFDSIEKIDSLMISSDAFDNKTFLNRASATFQMGTKELCEQQPLLFKSEYH